MSTKKDYSDDEWATLRRAPIVAGFAISLADPGGPIELSKEGMADVRMLGQPGSDEELLIALSQDAMAMAQERKNPAEGFELKGTDVPERILAELRVADSIVRAKATPQEVDAFRSWVVAAAQAAADAAKEGGFLGVGAVRVSDREQQMLEQIRAAIGAG